MAYEHFHDLAPAYLPGITAALLTLLFNSVGLPSVLDHTQLILPLGRFTCCLGYLENLAQISFLQRKVCFSV